MRINHINHSRWLSLPAVIAIGLLGAASASAGPVSLSLQSVVASSPSTGGSFEVDLTNNTGSAVVVDAFSFGLTASANFTFTSATTATTNFAYIFAGNSFFDPDIASSFGAGFIIAGDLWAGTGNGFSVADGATIGLGKVFFNVSTGVAPGPYTVSIVNDLSQTSLSDIDGNNIRIGAFNSGTITVPGTGTVPEPSTLAFFGAPLALLLLARKRYAPLRG